MLSVTGDAAAAEGDARGREVPAAVRGGMFLTPIGVTLFVSPLKWAVILAPLALVFLLSLRHASACVRRRRRCCFWTVRR